MHSSQHLEGKVAGTLRAYVFSYQAFIQWFSASESNADCRPMCTPTLAVLSAGLHILILNELGGRSILYIISYVLIELFSF